MSTDTLPVSLTMGLRQSSMPMHRTGSTGSHEASLSSKVLNAFARGAKNFLGVETPREVGVMLAAKPQPSLTA